jgi:thiosulfate/3-mercaptopyruvate sulfurtransferase
VPALITTDELQTQLLDPSLVVADLRWEASPFGAGIAAYRTAHIPGAVYLDLDTELSDRSDLSRGRHPLPDPQKFVHSLACKGIGQGTRLVICDDKRGSLALRLWWMLRWIGAPEAMLLDGSLSKWIAEGRAVETGSGRAPTATTVPLVPHVNAGMVATLRDVESAKANGAILLDARAPERFRGEMENVDARAGHIPGAVNAPWPDNLVCGYAAFKSPAELRARFSELGVTDAANVICYCGSGVTACHNLFAMELAGLSGARLYPGSWSEWVARHP